ncbi:hypothetical protein FHX76_003157 [Lysinibacter cavernae]|uniref:Uncharacterized protein n=1 Tax=Lysinibacter cavernae TaxID=1640652 RepID=A0A7X5R458_9MICO|nr:hypothetical protein [Lysinibacter cavernae]
MTLLNRGPSSHGPIRRVLAGACASLLLAAAATVLTASIGPASPASAAGNVSVTVEGRADLVGVADPTYLTTLRLSGTGFQSVVNGFGGIYVLFGWVSGPGWEPSQGGITGSNYRYVPDDEVNPVGYANFVTFPGSSTAYAANGGELAADGTWSTTMSVPGAVFTSLDREGNPGEVNCLQVQCGIITVGAHGVKNANNETFTPVSFTDLYGDTGVAGASGAVLPAPAELVEVPVPTPSSTTITEEKTEVVQAKAAESGDEQLIGILLWVIVGVGVLVVGAIAFLVWAVLSSRKKAAVTLGSLQPGNVDTSPPVPASEPVDAGPTP